MNLRSKFCRLSCTVSINNKVACIYRNSGWRKCKVGVGSPMTGTDAERLENRKDTPSQTLFTKLRWRGRS